MLPINSRYEHKEDPMKKAFLRIALLMMAISLCMGQGTMLFAKSLDEFEIENYLKPGASPMDAEPQTVALTAGEGNADGYTADVIPLDGSWKMMQGSGNEPYDYEEKETVSYNKEYVKYDLSGASVTASSQYQAGTNYFLPSNVIDGNFTEESTDEWVNDGSTDITPWFTVDLGETVTINGVILHSYGSLDAITDVNSRLENTSSFAVSVSCDGQNYTEIKRITGNRLDSCEVKFEAEYQAQYIKVDLLQPTQTPGDPWARIVEFEVFVPGAEIEGGAASAEYNKVDITGRKVTASSHYAVQNYFTPDNLVDGARESDATDAWISDGNTDKDPWFMIDLGYTYDVNGFTMYNFGSLSVINEENRAENTRAFKVFVSEDAQIWTEIYSVSDNSKSIVDVKLDRYYKAKYIKVSISEATQDGAVEWCRIAEFEIYAKTLVFNPSTDLVWNDAVDVTVPGSVHTALMENGLLEDPYVGMNSKSAKEMSFKTWWFTRSFEYERDSDIATLCFDGICDRCDIWLNGKYLGFHQGMFDGVSFDVNEYLVEGENTIIIRLYPAEEDWNDTVVYTAAYGWHYADIPPVGIWKSVYLLKQDQVTINHPFISTVNTDGLMDFYTELVNPYGGQISGTLIGTVSPKNFEGESYHFTYDVSSASSEAEVRLQFTIPGAQLWWPNGMGDQNLYTLKLDFVSGGTVVNSTQTQFGIRTLVMEEVAGLGEDIDVYNWTFNINGKKTFMMGADWCAIDALMRFDRDRYDRQLTLAREQGIRLLRAWGPGIVETDDFYQLCDEYGICVLQEWPTAWDSYAIQPEEVLYETVIENVKRIRNYPSLVMYGGGNEGLASLSARVLNEIGRLTIENDGTRPWHRQDPYGDSSHNYDSFHGNMPLEDYITYEATFIGEYGQASMMNMESISKYATQEEMNEWPLSQDGTLAWHCFVWNGSQFPVVQGDLNTMAWYGGEFLTVDSLEDMVLGSQLSQSLGYRHSLERARASWPKSTGICYYKLTDVYNCASWATVDVYGAPKIAHYFIQDSFAPLTAVAIFERLSYFGEEMELPIYLLDDADRLAGSKWDVDVKVYNSAWSIVESELYSGSGSIDQVELLGNISVDASLTASAPLFVVVDLYKEDSLEARNYYFVNYSDDVNSLFNLPATQLEYTVLGNVYTITNTGNYPAIGVHFDCAAVSDTFIPEDNYFFLLAGETKTVSVNSTQGVEGISCWNEADTSVSGAPKAVSGLEAQAISDTKIALSWNAEPSARGYFILRDGAVIGYTQASTAQYTDYGAHENETHRYTVITAGVNGINSEESDAVSATSLFDTTAPSVISAAANSISKIIVTFSEIVEGASAENAANYTLDGGASVTSATLKDDGVTIELTVANLASNGEYKLTVSNVRDASVYKNVMATQQLIISSGLQLYWDFNIGEGITLYDVTGRAGRGTLRYGRWNEEYDSSLGSSVSLDLNTGSLGIMNTEIDCTDTFTVMAYVKTTNSTASMTVLSHVLYPLAGHWQLSAYAGEPFFYTRDFYIPGTNTHEIQFPFGINVADGKWHHIAITFDTGSVKTYVDGRVTGSWNGIAGSMRKLDAEFSIGRLPRNTNRWDGALDEVRLYNRALTLSEITQAASILSEGDYIVLEKNSATVLKGSTYKIDVKDTSLSSISYASEDASVATVSADGTVTAISAGDTTVELSFNGTVYAQCRITVVEPISVEGGYSLSGSVTSENGKIPVKIELKQNGVTVSSAVIAATDKSGTVTEGYSISGIAAGSYDLVISKQGSLSCTVKNIAVNGNVNIDDLVGAVSLRSGDMDDNNTIDGLDVSLFAFDLLKSPQSAAYALSDINGDGYRDALDASIIASNMLRSPQVIDLANP